MEYSLSSSLIGGSGSLNPDKLSLDLQFATTKSLTAVKGPTPTFVRASTGTFVDYNGILKTGVDAAAINVARFDHETSYVGSEITIACANCFDGNGGAVKSSDTVLFSGLDANGYPLFIGSYFNVSYDTGSSYWVLSGASGDFEATRTQDIGGAYTIANGTGTSVQVDLFLACKGLLIEEGRSNQIKYSYNNFTNAYWDSTASNVTAVDSVAFGPNGISFGASSLTEIVDVSVSRHIHELAGVFTPVANSSYTMSAWVKQSESNPIRYVQLAFWIAGFGSTAYMNFDIQAGVVGTGGAGITNSSITAYPNKWYRITATATSVASPAASGFQLGFSTTSSAVRAEAYTVVAPTKSIYLWGAQVELGAFPTSYIPTIASVPITRSADLCSITGSAFTSFYNQPAGTVIANIYSCNGIQPRFNSFGPSRTLELLKFNGIAYHNGTNETNITFTATFPCKVGVTCTLNDSIGVFNGVLGGSRTSLIMPSPTYMNIGCYLDNALQLNGCISSIKFYKKRLTNAKLQSLTAP